MTKKLVTVLLLPMLLGGLTAWAQVRTITINGYFRGGLDPLKTYSPYELAVLNCGYRKLLKFNADGKLEGDIARSWTISKDGTTYTFTLQDGAKFSDGSPITTQDVAQSLNKATSEKSEIFHRNLLQEVIGKNKNWAKAVGKNRVALKLTKPFPSLLVFLTSPELSILKRDSSGNILKVFSRNKIKILKPNEKFTFVHNGRENVIEVISNQDQLQKMISSGQAQLFLGLTSDHVKSAKPPENYKTVQLNTYESLIFQLSRTQKHFADAKFRQALALVFRYQIWNDHQTSSWLSPTDHLIPIGLMPLDYYSKNPKISEKTFTAALDLLKKKLGNKKLKFWLAKSVSTDDFFKNLAGPSSPLNQVIDFEIKDFREVKDRIPSFDGWITDPQALIPDPESFLNVLFHVAPKEFPSPAKLLNEHLGAFRFSEDPGKKLENYIKIIHEFENENWILPLAESKQWIIASPEENPTGEIFHPANLICP